MYLEGWGWLINNLVEAFYISVSATFFHVSSSMSAEVVRAGEASFAAMDLADEGAFFGVDFFVSFQMFQPSERLCAHVAAVRFGVEWFWGSAGAGASWNWVSGLALQVVVNLWGWWRAF